MRGYCKTAEAYLRTAFDPRRALFSSRSRIDPERGIVNDFTMPTSLRYTINTYLGLSHAERSRGRIEWLGDVGARVEQFLELHEQAIDDQADNGLLMVLLAASDQSRPPAMRALGRIERVATDPSEARRLNMQQLAWMLWGTTSWASEARAERLAHALFDLIRDEFVHPDSGMPRHTVERYRAHMVSFGSTVYFLRALYEYGETFASAQARELFHACLSRVLALQCDDGAWPWMIDVPTATPIDRYPVFSVHQDSMAMLFLFPAELCGVGGIDDVIERSIAWNLGNNELGTPLVSSTPSAWLARSIERDERFPRVRRYSRSLMKPAARRCADASTHVRLNPECRSYHPGWVLYAWSDRDRKASAMSAADQPGPVAAETCR